MANSSDIIVPTSIKNLTVAIFETPCSCDSLPQCAAILAPIHATMATITPDKLKATPMVKNRFSTTPMDI